MFPSHIILEDYWINWSSLNPPYILTMPCFAQLVWSSWNTVGAIFFCLFNSSPASKFSPETNCYVKCLLITFLWIKFLFFVLSSYVIHTSFYCGIYTIMPRISCMLSYFSTSSSNLWTPQRQKLFLTSVFLTQCLSHSLLMHR